MSGPSLPNPCSALFEWLCISALLLSGRYLISALELSDGCLVITHQNLGQVGESANSGQPRDGPPRRLVNSGCDPGSDLNITHDRPTQSRS